MESILFVLEVIAFVVVVGWASLVEATGDPARGLLGMREEDLAVPAPMPAETGWRRVPRRVAVERVTVEKPKLPRAVGPTPAWRRKMRSDNQPQPSEGGRERRWDRMG